MEEEPVSENLYACPSCKVRVVEGELELCSVCKGDAAYALTCSKCGAGFAATHGHGTWCPSCLTATYSGGAVMTSASHSHGVAWTLPSSAANYTYYVEEDGTVRVLDSGSFVRLDGGELDLGLSRTVSGASTTVSWVDEVYEMVEEPTAVRGVGLTSLMLMDAAERKRAGLPVRVVVAVEREIDHMRSNPVLEDSGMTRGDFMTLGEATAGKLRGHQRSSVFVDHHVWDVGAPTYLDLLRLELSYLR